MTNSDLMEIKTLFIKQESLFFKQEAKIDCLEKTLKAAIDIIINRNEKPEVIPANERWLTPEEICELIHCKYDTIKLKKSNPEWNLIWRKSGKKLAFRADRVFEFMKKHNINE